MWHAHSDEVLKGLGDVGYTLGYLGRLLRRHAEIEKLRAGP